MSSRTTPPPFAAVMPPIDSATPPLGTPSLPRVTSPFSTFTPPFATATPPDPMPIVPTASLELDPEVDPEIDDIPPPPAPAHPPLTPPPPTPALGTQPPRGGTKVVIPPIGSPLPRGPLKTPTAQPPVKLALEEVVPAIADAISRDTATDVAMRYLTQRWASSLLLAVKEGAALGHRGHGPHLSADAVRAVAIPLTSPSIIKAAYDTRLVATAPPPGVGAIHERLLRLLDSRKPIAAPIIVAGRIACVLAVGEPIGSGDSAGDLDKIAVALGDSYARILRDMK
jgi:hypothetical protein